MDNTLDSLDVSAGSWAGRRRLLDAAAPRPRGDSPRSPPRSPMCPLFANKGVLGGDRGAPAGGDRPEPRGERGRGGQGRGGLGRGAGRRAASSFPARLTARVCGAPAGRARPWPLAAACGPCCSCEPLPDSLFSPRALLLGRPLKWHVAPLWDEKRRQSGWSRGNDGGTGGGGGWNKFGVSWLQGMASLCPAPALTSGCRCAGAREPPPSRPPHAPAPPGSETRRRPGLGEAALLQPRGFESGWHQKGDLWQVPALIRR